MVELKTWMNLNCRSSSWPQDTRQYETQGEVELFLVISCVNLHYEPANPGSLELYFNFEEFSLFFHFWLYTKLYCINGNSQPIIAIFVLILQIYFLKNLAS